LNPLAELRQLDAEQRHSLIQVIVELAGDAFSLLLLCVDEPPAQVDEHLFRPQSQRHLLLRLLVRPDLVVSHQHAKGGGQVEPRRVN
jgi:hypothetical protein